MRQSWRMWQGGLPEDQINLILKEGMALAKIKATTFNNNSDVRSSQVSWLTGHQEIQKILWNYVTAANEDAFNVRLDKGHDAGVCEMQFTEYHASESGHYDWHHDVNFANDSGLDRKLSITVQLTDPSEYQGGEFLLGDVEEPPDPIAIKTKGTVFIFPSYLQHTVRPVTFGTRRTLVAWFEGPQWQ